MTLKIPRMTAAFLAALMLSSCANGGEQLTTGDLPSTTQLPETTPFCEEEPAETDPTTGSYIISKYPDLAVGGEITIATEETDDETTTTADPEVPVTDEIATMYATDTLNVREKPSTEAKIVGQLNKGDEVSVTGYTDTGWYRIKYDGGQYFVFGEYLSYDKPEEENTVFAVPEGYRFQCDDDYFFVVNKEIRLPDDYSIETAFVQGSYELEAVAAQRCREMIEAAKADGIELKVLSAYRTVQYQQNLFDRNVKSRMEDYGMSYDEAVYDVSINIAPPGGSEHNAGLAVDIIEADHWDTYEEFEDTEEFAWLVDHCAEYGFILRYLKGKENITGYIYEPWHYRYVGVNHAKAVMESGLCLEEYFAANGY